MARKLAKTRTNFFSRGTQAQHLTLSVWCPLDGCDALIGQRDNCTVTVSLCSCTLHVYTQHGHNIVMNRAGFLAWASTLQGFPTMAISWPAFFFFTWSLMNLLNYKNSCVVLMSPPIPLRNCWSEPPWKMALRQIRFRCVEVVLLLSSLARCHIPC